MGRNAQFAVQQYQAASLGKWSRGRVTPFRSADEARRFAERCVVLGKATGAAAFFQKAAGDLDESGEMITIAAFGDVPPEVRDVLPF